MSDYERAPDVPEMDSSLSGKCLVFRAPGTTTRSWDKIRNRDLVNLVAGISAQLSPAHNRDAPRSRREFPGGME